MFTVSQLFYHPIKSLGAIQVSTLSNGPCGPLFDRRIMLIDTNGKFITQRQAPIMTLIAVHDLGSSLELTYGSKNISLPWPDFRLKTHSVLVDIWDDKVTAQLFSPEVSDWLSNILSRQVRLVYMDDSEHRQVDLNFSEKGTYTGFSDGFPFLLVSQASINFLSEKIGYELSVNRFRPNIVVSGCDPFEEDSWQRISIDTMKLDIVKPCSRCVIPTINLQTAESERAVLQVMLEYRKKGKNIYLGQNLVHSPGVNKMANLVVGQEVEVIK
jgi:uncharacterized protein YcbX